MPWYAEPIQVWPARLGEPSLAGQASVASSPAWLGLVLAPRLASGLERRPKTSKTPPKHPQSMSKESLKIPQTHPNDPKIIPDRPRTDTDPEPLPISR